MKLLHFVRVISAMLLLTTVSNHLIAAPLPIISYSLTVAESEKVAADPNDMMAQKMAAWKTQHELLACRDTPFFNLVNNSMDPTARLNSLRITIPATKAYHFDTFEAFNASPGISYSFSNIDTIQGGIRSKVINIQFFNFLPGMFFRFRTDIDNDVGNINMFTDYRLVLFDANGNDDSNNAKVLTNFTAASLAPNIQIPEMSLPDYEINGLLLTGDAFRTSHLMDMVQPFTFAQAIPEPGTWMVLGMVWVASCVGYGARRRRQQLANKSE
jgi:hypothetical protein